MSAEESEMKSVLFRVAVASAVALPIGLVLADDEKKTDEKTEKRVQVKVLRADGKDGDNPNVVVVLDDSDEKSGEKQSYLGVVIEAVPPALAAQLPDLVSADHGVMVAEVADDSPAAKAGLKRHDIIVEFGDTKLTSAEQLSKLVRGEKPGNEVTLGVIRAGKRQKVKVAIGEHEARVGAFAFPGRGGARVLVDPRGQRKEAVRILRDLDEKAAPGAKAGVQTKSSFSSMKLESVDGDRFKAEIEFKNEKGDSMKRSFEGTREEIRKQIEADEDMPQGIRNQLQRSLDIGRGGKGAFQFHMPRGGFAFDVDSNDFPVFAWPGSKDFDQIIEQLSNQIDPELREKLKGAFRSIEEQQPAKKPVPLDRSL
jgi:hypothetical protein